MWTRLISAGAEFGISPFGTEAMGVLRIEKGFIASGEIDGRTTPSDLGLDRMLSKTKDFIGKAALNRPGMLAPERPQIVGLVPLESGPMLRAGAHLLASAAPPTPARQPVASIGRVTSATFSATLGHSVALALLSGGIARIGETVHAAFPLKDECVAVRVVDPVFVDPEGRRARG
jgi:sarcosine oxidase subunit alpha